MPVFEVEYTVTFDMVAQIEADSEEQARLIMADKDDADLISIGYGTSDFEIHTVVDVSERDQRRQRGHKS